MPCVVILNVYPPVDPIYREAQLAAAQRRLPVSMALLLARCGTAPNMQAARFFAREVSPSGVCPVHSRRRLRVIGEAPHLLDDLRNINGVTLEGFVPDIEEALAGVDVVVAPSLLRGRSRRSDPRGFRRGIPVVATTMSAEGIDAVDGLHLLLADDPERFAAALVRLHGDVYLPAGSSTRHAALRRPALVGAPLTRVERLAVSVAGLTEMRRP